jgi:hypothetical protein
VAWHLFWFIRAERIVAYYHREYGSSNECIFCSVQA